MSANSIHPDPGQFAEFLRNDLPAEQHAVIDQHVSACDTCQIRMEQTAAESEWWTDAESFLSDDMIDHELAELDSQAESNTTKPRADVRTIVAWLDPTDDPRMLGRLAGYEIAGVIGSGGMGVVLKGLDTALNRYVAIKVLAPHLATSGAARQRFGREAQAAAAVVHDNVIAIHGVSEANDLPYLVMPYVRGISLQRRVDDNGALQVSEVLRIGMQTAAGLAAAHTQGLVHRDIKPANILLDGTTERVLLTDFGLARAADDASVTHSGVIAGTPHYMSPEQAQGEGIDHRSDLFSLGSVLFAISTGRPPFRAETNWGVLKRVAESDCPLATDVNSQVPVWLSNIIARLHQRTADARIQTAAEVHDVLAECLAHLQQPTTHSLPTAYTSSPRQAGSGRIIAWGLAFVTVVAFGWGIIHLMYSGRDPMVHGQTMPEKSGAIATDIEDSNDNVQRSIVQPTFDQFTWDDGTEEILNSIDESIQNLERD
ncbi:serine/threonine protein kinase [bacterium]|nr:serine/threonine protein kinase [bacterium]